MLRSLSVVLVVVCAGVYAQNQDDTTLSYSQGVVVGELSTLQYNVSGTIYALDEETLYIKDFYYDGRGPDAFFYIGTSGESPSASGEIIHYPQDQTDGEPSVLKRMDGVDVTLHLPSGFKISQDLKWFSVWCRQYSVDFGNVIVPNGLQIPEKSFLVPDNSSPVTNHYGVFLGELSTIQYEVSGTLYAIDEETLFIKDFNYNGKGPDAFFYIGTEDETPSHLGHIIRYPQDGENGEPKILGAYNKQDIALKLQHGLKISRDIKWFSVWCRQYSVDFGHVIVPRNLQIPEAKTTTTTTLKPTTSTTTMKPATTLATTTLETTTLATTTSMKPTISSSTMKPTITTMKTTTTPKAPMPDSDNGVYIGELSTLQYEVSGMVYAVDEETIHIEDFHYNGKGPDAFFYIGTKSSSPDHTGEIIPYPQDVNTRSPKILNRIWGEDITLQLPQGVKISSDLKWLSVWCRQYSVDFGNVLVPQGLQIPDKIPDKVYPEPEPTSEEDSEPEVTPDPGHNHGQSVQESKDSASDIVSYSSNLLYFTLTLALSTTLYFF